MTPLAIDAGDADDFSLASGTVHAELSIVGQGTTHFHVSGVDFFSTSVDEMRPAVDVRCEGQCTLQHTVIDSPTVGVFMVRFWDLTHGQRLGLCR